MNQSPDQRLDRFFSNLCAQDQPRQMPSGAWSDVERRLPDGENPARWRLLSARPLLAPSCAALLLVGVLLWTHPGFAAEVVGRIRRMFSGTFELQIGDSKAVVKEMTLESGKPSSVEIAENVITLTMREAGENTIMTEIRVAEKSAGASGKVLAAPKVVTRKGSRAEVTVSRTDSGKPIFRVKVVPTDAPDKAIGSVSEIK